MSPSEPTEAFGARFLRALRERAGGTPFDYATAKRIKGLERAALMEQLRKLAVADFGTLKRLGTLEDPEELARELAGSWRRMQAQWADWAPGHQTQSVPQPSSKKRERPPEAKGTVNPNVDTYGAKFVRALRKEWGGTPFGYAVTQEFKALEHAEVCDALVKHANVDPASLAIARNCTDPEQLAVRLAEAWRAAHAKGLEMERVRLEPPLWSAAGWEVEQASDGAATDGPFGERFLQALRQEWGAAFDYATTKRIKAMNREEVLAALKASGKFNQQTLEATEYFQSPERLARLLATALNAARSDSLGVTALEAIFKLRGVL